MKVVAISDTHEKQDEITIPECDILIHSGDITNKGSLTGLYKFCAWFKEQPAKHKIIIYGNHELGFSFGPKREEALNTPKQFGIIYLENSQVVIDGLKIYGSPITPFFYNWEWNVHRGKEIAKKWALVPDDTNVLITHGPPYGILDLIDTNHYTTSESKSSLILERDSHQGCEELRKKVDQLTDLKLHVFGHLHYQGGQQLTLNNKIFVNAAICNDKHQAIRTPQVIEI